MDERLRKKWQVTKTLLAEAASQVVETSYHREYSHFISHNEFGLALDVLQEAGQHAPVNREYWWNLKKAAEVMGLAERLNFFRQKIRATKVTSQ